MTKPWKRAAHPRDHYQEVTDKIVALLENGVLPWQRQWDAGRCNVPVNAVTKHTYRGINRIVLDMLGIRFGTDPRWCSYRQALARGWQVRRGETGTGIYFYKRIERNACGEDAEKEGEGRARQPFFPLLKAYTIFHASPLASRLPCCHSLHRWNGNGRQRLGVDQEICEGRQAKRLTPAQSRVVDEPVREARVRRLKADGATGAAITRGRSSRYRGAHHARRSSSAG
jgi:N-terminal domain of anti-restriction factor ArdC